jgi:hypothetical protein
MPELVDLPPELIERISIELEAIVYQELLGTDEVPAIVVPLFRLVNRYIENCTRRHFTLRHFDIRCIPTPDDASIKRFCAMAQVPDMSKCVRTLLLCVDNDNDIPIYAQEANDARQGGTNLPETWVADLAVKMLAPPAYARNRNALLCALRACSNIDELVFQDTSRDLDVKETCGTQVATSPARSGATRKRFDMTSSFNYVLSLAEEAGLRPPMLSAATHIIGPNETGQNHPFCGLTDCTSIAKAKGICHGLEDLSIRLVQDWEGTGITFEDKYVRFDLMEICTGRED